MPNDSTASIALRYGLNPHQTPATAAAVGERLPFRVRNGAPGYINLLDALSAWHLVRELSAAAGLPAAASFKHVSPAGAAVGLPLTDQLAAAYQIADSDAADLSPAACAYARARGGDLVSAYGDFAAVSDRVDASLARLLRREVSDGIVAPAYDDDALQILAAKKGGRYLILEADPDFAPARHRTARTLRRPPGTAIDDAPLDDTLFDHVVTDAQTFSADARRDLLIATIALRYTQSNSVCLAADGQVIGLGAGQQSRIHCTRIACGKADRWMLQQQPDVLDLPFADNLRRPDRFTAREQYIAWHELSQPERDRLQSQIDPWPGPLSDDQRRDWIDRFDTVLSHDAFIPFRDNVDRAQASAVRAVLQPGGSIADESVIEAANEYGIAMALTRRRLFRH